MERSPTEGTAARQAEWTYRAASEDGAEREFFSALEPEVAAEIGRWCAVPRRVSVGRELHLRVITHEQMAAQMNGQLGAIQ